MTTWSAVASFALAAGLLTIVPGLDTAMILRSTINQGRANGFATMLGITTGSLIWGVGAAVGVSALLTASEIGFLVVRVLGACYLTWLGIKLLWTAAHRPPMELATSTATAPPEPLSRSYSKGLLTNLLNPKIGAFYVAVLPQFIPAGAPVFGMGVLLTMVHIVEGLAWCTLLVLGASRIRLVLNRRSSQRAIDGVTGSVLVGFGVKLGLSTH
jgi:RhtB (resistance to homoserine/threonine) family protein